MSTTRRNSSVKDGDNEIDHNKVTFRKMRKGQQATSTVRDMIIGTMKRSGNYPKSAPLNEDGERIIPASAGGFIKTLDDRREMLESRSGQFMHTTRVKTPLRTEPTTANASGGASGTKHIGNSTVREDTNKNGKSGVVGSSDSSKKSSKSGQPSSNLVSSPVKTQATTSDLNQEQIRLPNTFPQEMKLNVSPSQEIQFNSSSSQEKKSSPSTLQNDENLDVAVESTRHHEGTEVKTDEPLIIDLSSEPPIQNTSILASDITFSPGSYTTVPNSTLKLNSDSPTIPKISIDPPTVKQDSPMNIVIENNNYTKKEIPLNLTSRPNVLITSDIEKENKPTMIDRSTSAPIFHHEGKSFASKRNGNKVGPAFSTNILNTSSILKETSPDDPTFKVLENLPLNLVSEKKDLLKIIDDLISTELSYSNNLNGTLEVSSKFFFKMLR